MSPELTVEEALKELRETFPGSRSILINTEWSDGRFTYEVEIAGAIAVQDDSLSDAMAQVRAWKESQKDVTR